MQASALTKLDATLNNVYRAIREELDATPDQFDAVRARRFVVMDDTAFVLDIGAARRECSAADIPFPTFDGVFKEVQSVYMALLEFRTAPCPPADARTFPLRLGEKNTTWDEVNDQLIQLQLRMMWVVNRLVEFRHTVLAKRLPGACLPMTRPTEDGSRTPVPDASPATDSDLATVIEDVVTRLRHDWTILFDKDWRYVEGLNGLTINALAEPLGRGKVFEFDVTDDGRRLTVRHPERKARVRWTTQLHGMNGWGGFTEVAKDKHNASTQQPKFTDTIEYLRAWASLPPGVRITGEEQLTLPAQNLAKQEFSPSAGARQGDGVAPATDASTNPPKSRIRRPEAERLVSAAIDNTPPNHRYKLTVRALVNATGVSSGMISKLDSWQKLLANRAGSVISVRLSDTLQAVLKDPSADAADPAEAAADAEVLRELQELATTDVERARYEAMTPPERWQMLEQLKEQTDDARRDQRRPGRHRPDRS